MNTKEFFKVKSINILVNSYISLIVISSKNTYIRLLVSSLTMINIICVCYSPSASGCGSG